MMPLALVTGCAGFIGSHLVEHLLGQGVHVHGIDGFDDLYAPELKRRNLEPSLGHARFTFRECDLADADEVLGAASEVRPDVVVHLAGRAGVRESIAAPGKYVRGNVVATENVLAAFCRPARVPLVLSSSSSVYGTPASPPFRETDPCGAPTSPYAATKRAAELLALAAHQAHGVPVTVLRLFTVYGPRVRPDLAIRKFATAMLRGQPVTVFGDGTMARDFTHVDDIVRGIAAAMRETEGQRVVNLGASSPCTVGELVERIEHALGLKPRVEHVARPAGEMDVTGAETSLARERWGWSPRVTLPDGLRGFAEWLQVEEAAGRNP